MRNVFLIVAFVWTTTLASAQTANTFKTSFTNSENNTIEISMNISEVIIDGGSGNEIIIESIGEKSTSYKQPKPPTPDQSVPDRAKGLKPLSAQGGDNTNLGVMVEKTEGHCRIQSGFGAISNKFKITVPNKVKLLIHEMIPGAGPHADAHSNYTISNLESEIIVTSLNSNFKLTSISGPLVLNTTNGNVEIVYSSVKTQKPISIVTINGFVDMTLPSGIKADLELQTMNGKAYTDFDIKSNDEGGHAMPIPHVEMFHIGGKINGGGGIKININSINGDIYLRKG